MAMLTKACKPEKLESHNFLKLTLQISEAFVRILLIVNIYLNQTLLTLLFYVRQTWLAQFFSERLSSFNPEEF